MFEFRKNRYYYTSNEKRGDFIKIDDRTKRRLKVYRNWGHYYELCDVKTESYELDKDGKKYSCEREYCIIDGIKFIATAT